MGWSRVGWSRVTIRGRLKFVGGVRWKVIVGCLSGWEALRGRLECCN